MKKNVKKHTDGVWYYAVVRWDGYGVFTSWEEYREKIPYMRMMNLNMNWD